MLGNILNDFNSEEFDPLISIPFRPAFAPANMRTILNFHFSQTQKGKPTHNLFKVRGAQEIKFCIEVLMQAIGKLICIVAQIMVGNQRPIGPSDLCTAA